MGISQGLGVTFEVFSRSQEITEYICVQGIFCCNKGLIPPCCEYAGSRTMGGIFIRSGCGSKWKTDVGPQMEMSSLVLTIQLLGYLILTHTQVSFDHTFLSFKPTYLSYLNLIQKTSSSRLPPRLFAAVSSGLWGLHQLNPTESIKLIEAWPDGPNTILILTNRD